MCFGGSPRTPSAPTPPPPPAPVQKLEPTKPPAPTPPPETASTEKPILKKKNVGSKKRERIRTGTASLQTAPGQGLNIGGGS